MAHAHFRLGSHLLQSGKDAAARHHLEQARRLHPESWNIWRQTHSRNELGFASGPEFWARVDALGERRYYEKVNIEGIPLSATLPKLPTARSHAPIAANGEPHSEGAGDQMAIVLFSFRGVRGDMILYLDKAADVSFRLGLPEFKATLAHQIATGATAKLGARAA